MTTDQAITFQTNDQGYVALRYHQPGQVLIQRTPSETEYVATTRANICMVWVKQEDVEEVLARKGGCCGRKKKVFHPASEDDVRRWTNGGGR